ncbi:MAG: hypothetical protein ACI9G1_002728 [Pirellulaceae bacterium]|jgi:hypothetical protein
MEENPYAAPASSVAGPFLVPVRLRRGRRVLLAMAGVVLVEFVWELFNYNLLRGWSYLPGQVFRVATPLCLIYVIWTGRPWARYALGLYCGWLLYCNIPVLNDLLKMYRRLDFGDVGQALLLLGGHLVIGGLSVFSSSITGLMYFRKEERESVGVGPASSNARKC